MTDYFEDRHAAEVLRSSAEAMRRTGDAMEQALHALLVCNKSVREAMGHRLGNPEVDAILFDIGGLEKLSNTFRKTCFTAAQNLDTLAGKRDLSEPEMI